MTTTNFKNEATAPANVRPSSVSKARAFAAHTANRELSTQTVLDLLKAQLPTQYELAEIVGRWIWLDFPARSHRAAANTLRRERFKQALKHTSAGSLEWLRLLHRSHLPQAGPFSTCMHRDDAATVSYKEVAISPQGAKMRHRAGAPCQCSAFYLHKLSRMHPRAKRGQTQVAMQIIK
ncbi:MAG: hypothetical protein P4L50_20375 [Anaerolineaceae bacterium]|nr:hypothetical protein [Anaerolineaceae bacterium]